MTHSKINILIVDDHTMFVNGLNAILQGIDIVNRVAVAFSGEQALNVLEEEQIDLVISDISMPSMNGLEFIKKAKEQHPILKIMVLSMHNETRIIKQILKLNPEAYLLKNTDSDELLNALKEILAGGQYYCDEIKTILINNIKGIEQESKPNIIPKLSPREKEVLALIAKELTTSEIADHLFLSLHTIETYRKNLLRKLDSKNSVGLVAKAYQYGLI